MNEIQTSTKVVGTKIIEKQLFYMLKGTKEYGNEPTVQAVEVARRLGYSDPYGQVQKVMKRNKDLLESEAFLIDLDVDVDSQIGHAHKQKTRARKTHKTWVLTEIGFHLFVSTCKTPLAIQERRAMAKCFVKMRRFLLRQARKERNQAWIEFRQAGKIVRKEETDEIQRFVAKAKDQGSKNFNRYYNHFTTMAKKALGLEGVERDQMTEIQLKYLARIEKDIKYFIQREEMHEDFYKDSYKKIQAEVMLFGAYYKSLMEKETESTLTQQLT